VVLLIFLLPQFLPHWARPHLLTDKDLRKDNDTTFITLPPDRQTPPKQVQTDRLSDKNRIAETPHPQIDRKTMEELRTQGNRRAPGLPGAPAETTQQAPPPPQPQMPQVAETTPPPVLRPPSNLPSPTQPQMPQEQSGGNPFKAQGSAGDLIADAARHAGHIGSLGAGGSGYGMGNIDRREQRGSFDILSDTQGVDFGPYLARLHPPIEMNWYNLSPESVRPPLRKHGKVLIRLIIMPDGKVTGMHIDSSSGDIALDRAAWGALTASSPFPPLPGEFHGPYLELLCAFYYNPTVEEMSGME
jgi:TonB family protein